MAEVIQVNPDNFELQDYNSQDVNLITSFDIDTSLEKNSTIEFHIYNNNILVESVLNFIDYTLPPSGKNDSPNSISLLDINPLENLNNLGYTQGQYIAYYNFLNNEIGNLFDSLYISEISSDRKEIRLQSNDLSNLDLLNQTENFIDKREESDYFLDFYLNFKNNDLIIANNIKIENDETDLPSILIKLYEPLPNQFNLKDLLYVVTNINESEAFQVTFPIETFSSVDYVDLQGPNFAIPLKSQINNSSQNLSYTDIISSAPTSSQNQIESLLEESSLNISVDYTTFSDFIHFSSAQTRIENFYYKVSLIETYTSQSNALINITGSSTSKLIIENKTSDIIKNFDQFEYFMYYSSGSSTSYPKSTISPPYTLYSTGSSEVLTWLGSVNENSGNYGGQLLSASNFDNGNPDQLLKSIPEYLREDPDNQPYDLFIDMVAQYYDNIWLYTKDITQKYNADNRLDFGVSKDLVSDAIKDFGVKLYQNNFSNQELYTAFLGITPSGSLFPFPEITGSLPVPSGMEYVDTLISASNDVISMDDTNKSLYKRIYHNIPYLLKSKGTTAGLRALITSYGIPDTILKISEFGGKDQVNANDYDLYFNNFNYAFNTTNNFISSSWVVNSDWNAQNDVPSTVQFRFKSEEFPPTNLSQSLWEIDESGLTGELLLDYSGSGLDSGSYNGSIKDPNYKVANLRFIPYSDESQISASISLPFYNGDWWSVMVTTDQNGTYNLYAGNKIYNGNDGTSLGYYASASVTGADDNVWTDGTTSTFASSSSNYPNYKKFSGSLQEIRYYNTQISESVFKDYVMNPLSFEGNGINSAPSQLIFRAALGSELLQINYSSSTEMFGYGSSFYGNGLYGQNPTGSTFTTENVIFSTSSIHPKVTGSWGLTSSFTSNSHFLISDIEIPSSSSYNTETFFLDQPAVGIKNRTTDKIRSENDTLASGNVLSPIRSLSQNIEASASYTPNINYLEVAFSPQNQINDDIIGQMGHFNIGDYIGDPAQRFSGNNYPDLNILSEDYFKKYIKQYNLVDFVRLIKFFDNSLFKMIKDFIPARTSLASGLVIKQHLLERNKYPQPQVTQSLELLTGSINSKQVWDPEIGPSGSFIMSSSLIESFNGGAAGMFNPFNISYDFRYISGSTSISNIISASSVNAITLTNGFANIPGGANSNIITNAPNLAYFSTYTPNLYIAVSQSDGTPLTFAFDSGSKAAADQTVSGSGTFSGGNGSNTLLVNSSIANTTDGIEFSKFRNQGHIQTSPSIFNNGSGTLVNASVLDNVSSTQIIAGFATQSIFTDVSGSAEISINYGDSLFNLDAQTTNAGGNQLSNFTGFRTTGFVSSSVPFFNDGSGNVSSKSTVTAFNTAVIQTTFPTASTSTDVSASGTITFSTEGGGLLRFNLIGNESNVSGGDMVNFQEFKDEGYITTTTPIFSGSGTNSQIASASVETLGSGIAGFRINGQLSPVLTPVSGSGDLNFFIGVSTGTTMSVVNPNSTNVSGNKLYNFDDFEDGYITTTNPIFSGSGPFTSVNSASINKIDNLFGSFSFLLINAVTSSVITPVSASGTATFSSNPSNVGGLVIQSYSTNATDLSFSGFDDGNAYISCSSDAFGHYPFSTPAPGFGVGIASIVTATNSAMSVSIFGRNGEYSASSITFAIMSGSAASVNSFISASQRPPIASEPFQIRSGSISQGTSGPIIFTSESIRNGATIINEPFTFRTGSISQGTAGSTTFISSSARPTEGTIFEFISGSIGGGTQTSTFISSSARNLNGVTFAFHTGSISGGGNTEFISSSLIPETHSRAQVASIDVSNLITFESNYNLNLSQTNAIFNLYSSLEGTPDNTFISSSVSNDFIQEYLNPTPVPIFTNVTQSYSLVTPSILGNVTSFHDSQTEFYDGELSGSIILVTNGELNEGCDDFKNVNPKTADYKVRVYSDTISGFTQGKFLQNENLPLDGYIQVFYGNEPGSPLAPELPNLSAD